MSIDRSAVSSSATVNCCSISWALNSIADEKEIEKISSKQKNVTKISDY